MTTFWKPCPVERADRDKGIFFKQLGNGAYELWCRCDLCFQTGVSVRFVFMDRGEEDGQLCIPCFTAPGVLEDLVADGWHVRE